jgi:hypothetical protein
MSDSDKNWERQLGSPPQCSSAAMSFQSAIPWQVALRQSLPPLHRLATILNNPLCRTMIFQRTVTTPLTSCLTLWVHFILPSPYTTPSNDQRGIDIQGGKIPTPTEKVLASRGEELKGEKGNEGNELKESCGKIPEPRRSASPPRYVTEGKEDRLPGSCGPGARCVTARGLNS